MNREEICRHIDDGANFYLKMLGNAEHMEYIDNGYYSIIRPKNGYEGATLIFDIRLEHLSEKELIEKVNEIKGLNLHTWWGINWSERLMNVIYGENRPLPATMDNEEEGCMALLAEHLPEYETVKLPITVKRVDNAKDFMLWAEIVNQVLHDGYKMIHPEKHYHLSEEGIMPCYIAYYNDTAAAVCSIMNNNGIASLEFVGTLTEYRGKGLAKAICTTAIKEAFENGSEIVTLRAFSNVKKFYQGLGFQLY